MPFGFALRSTRHIQLPPCYDLLFPTAFTAGCCGAAAGAAGTPAGLMTMTWFTRGTGT